MSRRAMLTTALGTALWVAAGIAAVFGIWAPLIALASVFGLLVLVFAGPGLWNKLASRLRR